MSSVKMDSTMAERMFEQSFQIFAILPIGHGPRHFSGLRDAKVAGDFGRRIRSCPTANWGLTFGFDR